MFLGCLLAGVAGAQTAPPPQNPRADWRDVEALAPGTALSIQLERHKQRCSFDYADEERVACSTDPPRGLLTRASMQDTHRVFRRTEIKRVSVEKPLNGAAIGLAAGAILGVAVGAIRGGGNSGTTRSGAEVVLGGIGALMGAVIGRRIPMEHGRVIYERP